MKGIENNLNEEIGELIPAFSLNYSKVSVHFERVHLTLCFIYEGGGGEECNRLITRADRKS